MIFRLDMTAVVMKSRHRTMTEGWLRRSRSNTSIMGNGDVAVEWKRRCSV